MSKMTTRCGRVALFGRPNAGKSTLTNAILKKDLCIVSRKAQTTRDTILGVRNLNENQLILLDTPGLHRHSKRQLGHVLNRTAKHALDHIDVACFVVDCSSKWNVDDQWAFDHLADIKAPVILVLNKIDHLSEISALLPQIADLSAKYPFAAVCPTSATTGEKLDVLLDAICEHLPRAAHKFTGKAITDKDQNFLISEQIRKQVYHYCQQELPYSCAIQIEISEQIAKTDTQPAHLKIQACIWVERDSQKGIVIGKGGQKLKAIGAGARQALMAMLHTKVELRLTVRLKENWPDDPAALQALLG